MTEKTLLETVIDAFFRARAKPPGIPSEKPTSTPLTSNPSTHMDTHVEDWVMYTQHPCQVIEPSFVDEGMLKQHGRITGQ